MIRIHHILNEIYFIILLGILLVKACCCADTPCWKEYKQSGFVCKCNATYCDTISRPKKLPSENFYVYSTSKENPGFNHNSGSFVKRAPPTSAIKFKVDSNNKFQKIRGFGGAFTDSFGYHIKYLKDGVSENLLNAYFSNNGIEYTVCRTVIGGSDFSLKSYNYVPDYDPSLESFHLLTDDYLYKIDPIKKAMNISKKPIYLFASSWNSPEWMKMKNSSKSGYIDPNFRQVWANYMVKYLDALKKEGIDIWALTTGNEPITLYMLNVNEVVTMFPEEQRDFIAYNLGPAIVKGGYNTKVIALDDMRLYATWWMDIVMRDKEIEKYMIGIGLHYYMDSISAKNVSDIIFKKFPGQEILYTESSVNAIMNNFIPDPDIKTQKINKHINMKDFPKGPDLGSWPRAAYYATNIIENLQHRTTTYVDWNMALDLKGGPNLNGFPCDAPIIVNETNYAEFYKQPMFYAMGHFSKFIQPDSVIIDIQAINETLSGDEQTLTKPTLERELPRPIYNNNIQLVGALNSDGSISIVIYNPKNITAIVNIEDSSRGYAYLSLEPKSLNTLIYW